MFSTSLLVSAKDFLDAARARQLRIATAESCTGGLIAALLTEIPGASDVMDTGFVTYSNRAKQDLLGVPSDLIESYGAVSAAVVRAMAEGVLAHVATVDLAVAVSGVAGPGGGSETKPVGLVYFSVARRGNETCIDEQRFGSLSRREIRLRAVANALALMSRML